VALPYGFGRVSKFVSITFIVSGHLLFVSFFLFLSYPGRTCGMPFQSRKIVEDGIRSVRVMDIGDHGYKHWDM
jgi:divalent metal cation (Fe/Co/Zn/Cd) transporter